ncbi:hypothetical protein Ciccas_001928 [Cichlidogyrus casuarinus]|uniref:Mediator of RNA polymerase II transcription subunit 13 n=1 Tax=Cichlidogyrus casuarinus TaxID=1844966 RepID=A0ABD2QIP1_9PLAT
MIINFLPLSSQLGTAFYFFLHGEATVCISLDLKRLPLVSPITKKHLQYCISYQKRIPVILCPYGLCAELIGPNRDFNSEEAVSEELRVWHSFYPITGFDEFAQPPSHFDSSMMSTPNKQMRGQFGTSCDSAEKLGCKFVDLLVSGYRMRYPTAFVLICNEDLDSSLFKTVSSDPTSPNCSKVVPSETFAFGDMKPSSIVVEMPSKPLTSDSTLQQMVNFFGPASTGAKMPALNMLRRFGLSCKKNRKHDKFRSSPLKRSNQHHRFWLCHGSSLFAVYSKKNVHFPNPVRRNFLADRQFKRSLRSISRINHKAIAKLEESAPVSALEAVKPLYISSSTLIPPSKSVDCFCPKLAALRSNSDLLTMEDRLPFSSPPSMKRMKPNPYHRYV